MYLSYFCILKIADVKYIKQDVLVRFGQIVRRYREDMNISQEELAFRAGLHRTYIGMIERAEKNVTLCNIKKIADALGIDIKDLFD
ncbi:DNA-binding helix-turn-helix protein [Hoylesella oralis ATCC 33269]|uniref:DNA-binding helix-turn-helix protein n=1 Tax=Hoylesella oralis ATCC 33269 TaxID=873533 RepID=E7RRP4_9BACT|nr:helix-turn-helix transcriptional regulator [Hoylesella oralis]EFZ36932.1 DNA-binding helix-turn-helix protein [Hoylesella oralis ATCC 33269]